MREIADIKFFKTEELWAELRQRQDAIYGEFELQTGVCIEGFPSWLLLVHKPCGVDVLPVEWTELDLEVANSFAFNHLKDCQKRVEP